MNSLVLFSIRGTVLRWYLFFCLIIRSTWYACYTRAYIDKFPHLGWKLVLHNLVPCVVQVSFFKRNSFLCQKNRFSYPCWPLSTEKKQTIISRFSWLIMGKQRKQLFTEGYGCFSPPALLALFRRGEILRRNEDARDISFKSLIWRTFISGCSYVPSYLHAWQMANLWE